jgi:hypothetical protein
MVGTGRLTPQRRKPVAGDPDELPKARLRLAPLADHDSYHPLRRLIKVGALRGSAVKEGLPMRGNLNERN